LHLLPSCSSDSDNQRIQDFGSESLAGSVVCYAACSQNAKYFSPDVKHKIVDEVWQGMYHQLPIWGALVQATVATEFLFALSFSHVHRYGAIESFKVFDLSHGG